MIATVDFGKTKNVGYCRCPDGIELPSIEFANTGDGFKKFWSKIFWMKNKHKLNEIVFGFESTGCYAEPLTHFLQKHGVKLVQVNCAHTKRVKEIYDNSPNKTDDKDPKVIADLIELGRTLTVVIPGGVAAELRRLSHARERHGERRKTLYNQLHDVVYLIFPEFLSVMKNLDRVSSQYLLSHYPTPEALLQLGIDTLSEILRKVSRGKLNHSRAEALYSAAQDSVGLQEGRDGIVDEIHQILSHIALCDSHMAANAAKMADYLEQVPYSEYMLSMKGIGKVTVAGLIGEIGDFGKFKTIGELLKYAGLNLYEISSGAYKGRKRISKRGRPLIRKLLYFAALNVVRKAGILHDQYQAYLERGMVKLKALIAICRKLLSIFFALVRDHSVYINNFSDTQLLKKAA